MKIKYTDFVSEALNSVNFSDEYNAIRDSLEDFWALLTDKIEEFNEINSRNLQDVANFNQKSKSQSIPTQPAKPAPAKPAPAKPAPAKPAPAAVHKQTRSLTQDDTPTLIKKLRNPQFRKQKNEILRILDERNKKAMKTQQVISQKKK